MRGRTGGALVAAINLALVQQLPAFAEGFRITSPAFAQGSLIPKKHTCDRAGLSPPLRWTGAPPETRSFAVVAEDPDVPAGSWAQWIIYDLPGDSTGVPQGIPPSERLPNGAKQGRNEFGAIGYAAPCPPPGKAHHYWFRVYALDRPTKLEPGASKAEVFRAIRPRILRIAEVMGSYRRRVNSPPAPLPHSPSRSSSMSRWSLSVVGVSEPAVAASHRDPQPWAPPPSS